MPPWPEGLPGSQEIGGTCLVVGGGGEPSLEMGIGQTWPAQPPEAVRAFPGPEDLLDPGSYPVDRAVPFGQPALGLTLRRRIGSCPDPDGRDPGRAAPRPHHRRKATTPIRTVGIHLAGTGRQGLSPWLPSWTLPGVTAICSTSAVSASAPTCTLYPCIAFRRRCPAQPASASSRRAAPTTLASTSVPVFTCTARRRCWALIRSNRI